MDYKAFPVVVLKFSHFTSGCTCLHAPPHKWLHPVVKEVSRNCPFIGQCLNALSFSITSVLLLPTLASPSCTVFSMLWVWPPFLCLFINPMSLSQVLAPDSLCKPSVSLLSRSLLKSKVSPLSRLLFCHLLGLSAVTEYLLPVPAIHSCEFNNFLSNPVRELNIYTALVF